ncbi:hypothetical protein SAMN02910384_01759 [Pseudobutyrivibrio sp. ACV-2]|uniref:hypothetical protein n=1 Tax=Pseudobutyrivibrio sp. ACV-2 TaxID=1520801 RepID=UPI0008945979|nr:hypothetical protein [Pseudobutyrivibrio sp. ACV-2]SEA56014.1 hypothetical protein SAMN02910384_01759 [Pseudobutyrivibrio sp. ACV-2]
MKTINSKNSVVSFMETLKFRFDNLMEERALKIALDKLGYSKDDIQYSRVSCVAGLKIYDIKIIAGGQTYYYTVDMTTGRFKSKTVVYAY